MWDLFVLVLVLLVSLIVPYRLAFTNQENLTWFMIYMVTDIFFLIDIIVVVNPGLLPLSLLALL